jgi:hypothetical protein
LGEKNMDFESPYEEKERKDDWKIEIEEGFGGIARNE